MRTLKGIIPVAAILVLGSLAVSAQITKGFSGSVIDRDGKPVVGITVSFEEVSNPQNTFECKTNEEGRFIYGGLPYASEGYTVSVQLEGLPAVKKVMKPKMLERVRVDFDMREDLQMVEEQEPKEALAADAKELYDFGDYEGAMELIDKAIAAEDNVKMMMFLKAACLVSLERFDEAIVACEAYDTAYPGDTNMLGQLAQLYEKKGDEEKADYYTKKFKEAGGKIQNESFNEGAAALKAGDLGLAGQKFRQALRENPKDGEAHKWLGIALARQGKNAEAVKSLERYLELVPDAPDRTDQEALIGYLSQ